MPSPVSIALRAVVEEALDGLWTWKPSGTAVIFSPISRSVCDVDAGIAAARIVGVARGFRPDQRPSSQSALFGL